MHVQIHIKAYRVRSIHPRLVISLFYKKVQSHIVKLDSYSPSTPLEYEWMDASFQAVQIKHQWSCHFQVQQGYYFESLPRRQVDRYKAYLVQ